MFKHAGIGEYVEEPARILRLRDTDTVTNRLYSISRNAVVVNEATPPAITQAVLALYRDRALMAAIGAAARETVLSHYTVSRQMRQYADLYRYLHSLRPRN